MLHTAAAFDRASARAWRGRQVTSSKYFLGLPAGTRGQVLGLLEVEADYLLLVVEWSGTTQAVRRLDIFSREEAERYLLPVTKPV
jgi:hypothetical protein